jgi:hypothetical protein
MADVRIGINSEFNDSGFQAALSAINKLQNTLKKNNDAMKKVADQVSKASGSANSLKKQKNEMDQFGRSIDNVSRKMENYVRQTRQLSMAEKALKANRAQSKSLLTDATSAQDALNRAQMAGYKNTRDLASAQKQAQAMQRSQNSAVRDNSRLMNEAKAKVDAYNKSLAILARTKREAGGRPGELTGDAKLAAEYVRDNKADMARWQSQLNASRNLERQLQDRQKRIDALVNRSSFIKAMNAQDSATVKAIEAETRAINKQYAQRVRDVQRNLDRIDRINAQAAAKAAAQANRTSTSLERQRQQAIANPQAEQAKELALLQQSYGNKARFMQMGFGPNMAAGISTTAAALTRLVAGAGAAAGALMRLASAARTAAAALLNGVARAAQMVSTALNRIGSGANSGLTRLRTSLMQTGQAALGFGTNMQKGMSQGSASLERSAAGWSLLMAGRTVSNAGQGLLSGGSLGLDKYMSYEAYANRAAIAGGTDINTINQLVTGMARGSFGGPAVKNLSLSDIAQGSYYLSSAVGLKIDQDNMGQVAQMLNPLLQVAGYTMTSPETMIKGAMNIAQEFGVNPRDMGNSGLIGNIGSTMGFLANESTMEVPDIVEAFKMMGPMMNRVSGGSGTHNMAEAMAWTYFASNAGLRGSQIGRSLDMFTSRLLDPTGPAMTAASEAFGIEDSENGWRQFFFDANGDLRGGLGGAIEKFANLSETNPAMQDALIAQMFPQNAQRGLLGALAGMESSDFDWDEFVGLIEIGEGTKAQEMLQSAIEQTNLTLGSASQNMANAWDTMSMSIIDSIKGPLIAGLDAFSNVLFELSDIFTEFPEIGQIFAGIAGGIGIVLTLAGAFLSLVGVLLVFQRAMLFMSASGGIFGALLASIPGILLTAIPAILATMAALILLKTAWDSNLLGVQDFASFLQSGNISEWFATDLVPKLEPAIIMLNKFRVAMTELVQGIFLGMGGTNNLGAFMEDLFGEFLGGALYGKLLQLQTVMTNVRESISKFFSGMDAGGSIKDALYSIQGFFELLTMGMTSLRNMRAIDSIGDMLGINNLGAQVIRVTDIIRGAIQNLRTELAPVIESIRTSLGEIFDEGTLDGFMDFITGFAQGFGAAILGSILAIGNGIAFILEQIAQVGSAGSRLQAFIEDLTGVRVEIENIGQVAGAVFGALLVGRILSSFLPLGGIISLLAGVGVGLVQLGVTAGIAAARLALFAVAAIASAGASLLMSGSFGALLVIFGGLGFVLLAVSGYFIGLQGSLNAIGGIVSIVGAGFSFLASNLETVLTVIAAVVAGFAALTIASAVLGVIMQVLTIATAITSVAGPVGLLVVIGALILAFHQLIQMDISGWASGVFDAFSEVFEALSNTESIDEAEEVITSRIALMFANMKVAMLEGIRGLIEVFAGGGDQGGLTGFVGNVLGGPGANILEALNAMGVPIPTVADAAVAITGIDTYIANAQGQQVAAQDRWDAAVQQGINNQIARGSTFGRAPVAVRMPQPNVPGGHGILQYGETSIADQDLGEVFTEDWYIAAKQAFEARQDPQNAINNAAWTAMSVTGGQLPPELAAAIYSWSRQSGNGDEAAVGQMIANAYAPTTAPVKPPVYIPMPEGGMPYKMVAPEGARISTLDYPSTALGDTGLIYNVLSGATTRVGGSTSTPASGGGGGGLLQEIQNNQTVQSLIEQFGIDEAITELTTMLGIDPNTKPDELIKGLLNGEGSIYDSALQTMPPEVRDALRRYQLQRQLRGHETGIPGLTYDPVTGAGRSNGEGLTYNEDYTPTSEADVISEIMAAEEEARIREDNIRALNQQLMASQFPTDLPSALQNQFNAGPRLVPSGFDPTTDTMPGAYRAGVTGLGMFGDNFLGSLPEGSPEYANMDQLMADFIGLGGGEDNMLGKNFRNLLANDPGIQRFAQAFGLSMEEALLTVPQYIHTPELIPTVMSDLFGGIDAMGPEMYTKLNEGLNINWTNLGQFAASQAEAGVKSWNLADFIAQEWGVSIEEANQYIRDHGIDPDAINESLFKDTQQMVNSAYGTINLISPETYDLIGEQLQNANDKILEVTQAQFDAMSTSEKQALSSAGYTFTIVVDTVVKYNPPTIEDYRSTAIAGTNSVYDVATGAMGGNGIVNVTQQTTVDVTANMSPAQQAFAAWTADLHATATVDVIYNNGAGITTLPGAGTGSTAGGGTGLDAGLASGAGFGATMGGGMSVVVTVTADTSSATGALTGIQGLLQTLADYDATPTVTAQTSSATGALTGILGLLEVLTNYDATPTVTVGGGASGVLSGILGQLGSINGYVATATVVINTVGGAPSMGAIGANYAMAEGGYAKGGLTLVGEEGPEIVNMPYGAYVYTAQETQAMLANSRQSSVVSGASVSSGNTIVNINGPHNYNNEMDMENLVDVVERRIGRRQRKAELRGTVSTE